jgi:prepilin-type processing-associated H-X9-DG protein
MHASEDQLAVELEAGALRTRGEEWGDQCVRHCDLPPGTDLRPLLQGLPGDRCECPHHGYVFSGSINVQYADGSVEVSRAGDLYYWPAGHVGWTDEGVRFIEFSPADQIRPVLAHLAAQVAAAH